MSTTKRSDSPFRADAARVALIAHDARKEDLTEWANFNRDTLARCSLVATGITGKMIAENTGLNVTSCFRALSEAMRKSVRCWSNISSI